MEPLHTVGDLINKGDQRCFYFSFRAKTLYAGAQMLVNALQTYGHIVNTWSAFLWWLKKPQQGYKEFRPVQTKKM